MIPLRILKWQSPPTALHRIPFTWALKFRLEVRNSWLKNRFLDITILHDIYKIYSRAAVTMNSRDHRYVLTTYSCSVSVTDFISDLVDMETYWIPSNRNTYLSNNLHDFGKEKKIKERLSSQDR